MLHHEQVAMLYVLGVVVLAFGLSRVWTSHVSSATPGRWAEFQTRRDLTPFAPSRDRARRPDAIRPGTPADEDTRPFEH